MRDYSQNAYDTLKAAIKAVEPNSVGVFTEWWGDGWYNYRSYMDACNVSQYVDAVNGYHASVVSRNLTAQANMDVVFANVNTVSQTYTSRFAAILAELQAYKQAVNELTAVVSKGGSNFNASYINDTLKTSINNFLALRDNLRIISGSGLTEEMLEDMNEEEKANLLTSLVNTLYNTLPDLSVGQEYRMSLGSNAVFYYKVEGSVDNASELEVKLAINKQKLELKGVSIKKDGPVSFEIEHSANGDAEISVGNDSWNVDYTGSNISVSYSAKEGNNSYEYTLGVSVDKFSIEYAITTDFSNASITSTVGVEKRTEQNWEPLKPAASAYATLPLATPYDSLGNMPAPVIYVKPEGITPGEVVMQLAVLTAVVTAPLWVPAVASAAATLIPSATAATAATATEATIIQFSASPVDEVIEAIVELLVA